MSDKLIRSKIVATLRGVLDSLPIQAMTMQRMSRILTLGFGHYEHVCPVPRRTASSHLQNRFSNPKKDTVTACNSLALCEGYFGSTLSGKSSVRNTNIFLLTCSNGRY